jgi:uncharacterized membrane protein
MPMQATTTTPLFAAQLTPNRTLSRRGYWALGGWIMVFAFTPTLESIAVPWWAIGVLMALAVIAFFTTLYLFLRRGQRRENIVVWPDQIEWVSTDHLGQRTLHRFDPQHVRLRLQRDLDERTIGVHLHHEGQEYELGAFLTPDDKSSFAKALGRALRKARA